MARPKTYHAAVKTLGSTTANGILALCALNKINGTIYWLGPYSFIVFGREVNIEGRSKKNLWGRFGGGWNFELGIQGWPPQLVNCGWFSIRIFSRKTTQERLAARRKRAAKERLECGST